MLWFQRFSPALDLPFKAFTMLGEEPLLMLLLPLIYWCVDRRTGVRLTFLVLISAYVNALAKVLAGQPRPFEYDLRVRQLYEASGGGLPSGHTQGAVVLWGYLAARFRKRWLVVLCGLLMILIPLSRIYLGVHFPTDLLGGYLLGALLLGLFIWLESDVGEWLGRQGLVWQLVAALALPAVLLMFLPAEDDLAVSATATVMGMSIGFVLEPRWVSFQTGGVWWRRALRFALGAAALLALRFGLKAVFSGLEPALVLRFVRYALLGIVGALGAPWAFVKLGLAESARGPAK